MPRRRVENTYLVEHYRPGLTAEELGHCVTGIQDALRGLEEEDADATYQRIGTTFDRISLAVVELDPAGRRTRRRPDTPTAGKGTTR
jgi:hypothetical protein